MCKFTNKSELFLRVPNERAISYGFSARIGALCIRCCEVMYEMDISDEDVALIVTSTRIIPEIFAADPFDPDLMEMMEEELEEVYRLR